MKLRLLLTLVGLVSAPQALANWYEIEMLVFSRQADASLKEDFKAPTQALQPGKALDLIAPSFQPRVMDLIKAIPAFGKIVAADAKPLSAKKGNI